MSLISVFSLDNKELQFLYKNVNFYFIKPTLPTKIILFSNFSKTIYLILKTYVYNFFNHCSRILQLVKKDDKSPEKIL